MKRTIKTLAFTAALLLTVGVGSSFARSNNVARSGNNGTTNNSTTVKDSNGDTEINAWFHKDFQQAEMLTSTTGNAYTRITFRLNGMILTAYYSKQGELLAVTHNITSDQLPISLLLQVKREYNDYWISDLFEYNADGQSTYYITLENADKKLTLRSNEGSWETFTKTTKE